MKKVLVTLAAAMTLVAGNAMAAEAAGTAGVGFSTGATVAVAGVSAAAIAVAVAASDSSSNSTSTTTVTNYVLLVGKTAFGSPKAVFLSAFCTRCLIYMVRLSSDYRMQNGIA